MNEQDVMKLINHRLAVAGSQKVLAKELRVSQQYLNDILRGRRTLAGAILDGLGLVKVVVYERRKPQTAADSGKGE